ncbi:CrcB family protein [Leuconostocaceae bacterium ESL0958]|nr:CrcB family protein [Leuconostocaceae bacterium ESL0958]
MFTKLLLVMVGTGLGAFCRYLVLTAVPNQGRLLTLVSWINLAGCFLLGLFSPVLSGALQIFLVPGFLAGLTTFSTMMTEARQQPSIGRRCAYLAWQLIAGFVLLELGLSIGHHFL